MAKLTIDFDGNWKEIIEEFFEDFVAFFLPKLYPEIDFSRSYESLDKELSQILEAIGSTNKRIADKLVKVWLKGGTEKWILIHIEVQSYFEKLFSRRMYEMFSMIFNKYKHPIVALAIYTNTKTPRLYNKFIERNFGTSIIYRFIAYRIMRQDEAQLLASDNIFALFVLANYYVNKTRKNLRQRLELKEKMMELGMERNILPEKIDRFYYFIDNIMQIPLNLQEEFKDFILSKKKIEPDMPSVLFEKQEYWRGVFAAAVREDLEKERQEREKERQEHEKEREKLVLKLYVEIQWSADKIADVLDIPIEDVKRIIAEYIKKQAS